MTEEERKELTKLVRELRSIAVKIGTLSGLWDVVMDAELFLGVIKGGEPIMKCAAKEWIEICKNCIERRK